MNSRFTISSLIPLFLFACSGGFERFVPPSNSISGRGAKVPPHIIATTPTDGASVSPITGSTGTQIKVVFDMTMNTAGTPIINTYFRDLDPATGANVWLAAANSGATFSWSSTNVGDDTLTIQLGWVRWPENNVIGFDFNNSSLVNLDSVPLENSKKFSFTVEWDTGRYKTVHTGQHQCYFVSRTGTTNPDIFQEQIGCRKVGDSQRVGAYDYPNGQNGMIDPRNSTYGGILYGSGAGTIQSGSRFNRDAHPQNINLYSATNCTGSSTDQCNPFSVDAVTTLVWKTCSEGQYYADQAVVGAGQKCLPGAPFDYTYGNAINACSSLNRANNGAGYGGRTDWRLPTAQELENLVDYGARVLSGAEDATDVPAIHGFELDQSSVVREGAFPDTSTSKAYWTSTGGSATYNGVLTYFNAFVVEFKKGGISPIGSAGALLESARATTNRKKVRCVAGPTVLPSAPSLTVGTAQAGAQSLNQNAVVFTASPTASTFNVVSATSYFDIVADTYKLDVTFDQAPDATTAQTVGNYCIGLPGDANFVGCSTAVTLTGGAILSGNTVTLGTGMHIPGRLYKVFVRNVTQATPLTPMTTDRAYFTSLPPRVSPFSSGTAYGPTSTTFNVLRASAPSSTTIQLVFDYPPDLPGANNALNYCITTLGAGVCPPSSLTVTSAVRSGFTVLLTTSTPLVVGTTYKIFVTGLTSAGATPVGIANAQVHLPITFNITSASSPNSSTVVVTFDKLPDSAQAANAANYCLATGDPAACAVSSPLISSAAVSGNIVTLTTATTLTPSVTYKLSVPTPTNITYAGANIVTDNDNNLLWMRCRLGVYDNSTCSPDGISTNDLMQWNDGLNNCDQLNAMGYAGYAYGWRAPTINELKSIGKRSLFMQVGYSIDTSIFPTSSALTENFGSSTHVVHNGVQTPGSTNPSPASNKLFWTFSFAAAIPAFAEKDKAITIAGLKPPKTNYRCVRSLP